MQAERIIRWDGAAFAPKDDLLSGEIPLTIMLGGRELATLLCSPGACGDLVAGFLFTAGVIAGRAELASCTIDEEKGRAWAELAPGAAGLEGAAFRRLYTSGCGRGLLFHSLAAASGRAPLPPGFTVPAAALPALMSELEKRSEERRATGCTHAAALAGAGKILFFAEDIGRHNAADKVIGAALSAGADFSKLILLSSGRASSDLVVKARRAGTPVAVSRGAPTAQAAAYARETGLTLAAFLRGAAFNVYSRPERIAGPSAE